MHTKINFNFLEAKIDRLVYKLYNLTWEEVKIVDPEFAMSAEEYKKIEFE
jgi:adenine-specific DNA-methyltransferase